ncbi:MAG TPA: hypothetical protein VF184_06705 [Phycisphaeraceae bacterium]
MSRWLIGLLLAAMLIAGCASSKRNGDPRELDDYRPKSLGGYRGNF